MKIIVIGGTGLIGSKLVAKLREHGHEAVPAAPNTGVDTLTGEGPGRGADRRRRGRGRLQLPVVRGRPGDALLPHLHHQHPRRREEGRRRPPRGAVRRRHRPAHDSGYFRAKQVQEQLIKDSGLPYSIVHATQFFEFVGGIADEATHGDTVRLSNALIQPMASEDVAAAVGRVAVGAPTQRPPPKSAAPNSSASTSSSARPSPSAATAHCRHRSRSPLLGRPAGEGHPPARPRRAAGHHPLRGLAAAEPTAGEVDDPSHDVSKQSSRRFRPWR